MQVTMTVNGTERTDDVEPRLLLAHYLREVCGLKATNIGCDTTSCGACTVLLDGESVKSCTVLAAQASGHEITTVEGLATNGQMHPVQRAFHTEHGLQCGFCTPGFLMLAEAYLATKPQPDREEVREVISANLCRCTGYQGIVDAVYEVAQQRLGAAHD
jgi:carbon-monoxide dehydrogenase small subunit